jgi:signal transduction histidine kinase
VAIVAVYTVGHLHHGMLHGKFLYFAFTMTVGMLVGLWAWAWRPKTHMGPLMFWWPALWLAGDLSTAYPSSAIASTVSLSLFVMGLIVFGQMALSYPTGRLMPGGLAWIYIFILGYLAQAIQNVVNVLYWDLSECPVCPPPREPTPLNVGTPPFSLQTWNDAWLVFVLAILPIGLYLLIRRYADASPGARRSIGPVLVTASFITCTSWITGYAALTDRFSVLTPLSWIQTTGGLVAALTALFGLVLTRRARGSVGDLVVELDRVRPGSLRPALARAIGDPTLELALWLPDRGIWVDETGHEIQLPHGRERAVTMVGDDLAAMIHDPVLLDQPALLEAAGSATHLALENERLQAELRAQVVELQESRARIVRAGDDERRRLERDLHDGAQQRLLATGLALQLLRTRLPGDGDAGTLLGEAEEELQGALAELRERARGSHPAILSDQGLAAAVRTLADRSPVPVAVTSTDSPLPAHVETAFYFVASETLANVTKHSGASQAWITVSRDDGVARLQVRDDGRGGAHEDGGSGLGGLADRIGALGGTVTIVSQQGQGTTVTAEVPCE